MSSTWWAERHAERNFSVVKRFRTSLPDWKTFEHEKREKKLIREEAKACWQFYKETAFDSCCSFEWGGKVFFSKMRRRGRRSERKIESAESQTEFCWSSFQSRPNMQFIRWENYEFTEGEAAPASLARVSFRLLQHISLRQDDIMGRFSAIKILSKEIIFMLQTRQ